MSDGPGLEEPAPPSRRVRKPIPWYWWPIWIFLLVLGLFVFYGVFTPAWIAIRLTAWLSERSSRRGAR